MRVGKVVDDAGSDGSQIVVRGNNKNTAGVQTLFSAPFVGVAGFQNFGLKMDFDAKYVLPRLSFLPPSVLWCLMET